MARKLVPAEVNSFVGGIITDANPLTFPQNASVEEYNILLNSDGSRNRRLGMDFEDDSVEITTTITQSNSPAHTTFKWENVGGNPDKTFLVVQFGNKIDFFDFDNSPLSSEVIYTHEFNISTFSSLYSYTAVDGSLIVVTSDKVVNSFLYDDGTITHSEYTLKIRDLFGVEALDGTTNLRDGNNVSTRPINKVDTHIYNLRNQSFGKSLVCSTASVRDSLSLKDPIAEFKSSSGYYPSNADSVSQALYADANLSSNRTIDRFFVEDLEKTPIGTTHAASGHFIIDALERGTSRLAVYADMMTKYPELTTNISTIPLDKTSGGASAVAQFAGRVWYGGFSGAVVDGDNKSPKLSSYIMFSQLVEDPSDIVKCYQEGDPTSKEEPDLLDTDGGFIRLDEAFGIMAFKVGGNSLFALAQNGVWKITGGAKDEGFTATNYSANKISDVGCISSSSVVSAEGVLYFWGKDGIFVITPNEYGDWGVKSISQNRIQKLYNNISSESKRYSQGFYDGYDQKVRWVYDNVLGETDETRELIFDVKLGAFSSNIIKSLTTVPKVVGIYESPPFKFTPGVTNIEVGNVQVVVGANDVVIGVQTRDSATREVGYIAVTSTTGNNIKYRFCSYKDSTFYDWKSVDNVGVDADGVLITGYVSGGDFQRQKQLNMLTLYFNKTETGFENISGEIYPKNPSSCKVQSQWEWTNSLNSNRWGTEFQGYRHKTHYIPEDENDTFNNGYEVVVTKNKIRGKGRVISLKFSTEPGKDFHILGWSMMMGIMTDV